MRLNFRLLGIQRPFLKEQKHDDSPYDQLGDVIAITGTLNQSASDNLCSVHVSDVAADWIRTVGGSPIFS